MPGARLDAAVLAAVVCLTAAPYVGSLGFYSDDWAFLNSLNRSRTQSIGALYNSLYDGHTAGRPGQALYLALLYRAFGLQPLGYHVVNTLMLAAVAVLLYAVLRTVTRSRLLAFGVAVVFACLPHYSTDRFWVAAFQAPLAMALMLGSVWADRRAVVATRGGYWLWVAAGTAALVASALSYEPAIPLALLSPLLAWYGSPPAPGRSPRAISWRSVTLAVRTGLALAGLVAFKFATTSRLRSDAPINSLSQTVAFFRDATTTAFGDFGIALPRSIGITLRQDPAPVALISSAAVGVIVAGYLLWARRRPAAAVPGRASALLTLAAGAGVFLLAWAVFLPVFYVGFTSTGINNRVAIAAAVGVALVQVGAVGLVTPRHPVWGPRLYAAAAGTLCAAGVLITTTLAGFWVSAYREEQRVLTAIREALPTMPPGTTLLLDGVCPYEGPAIVFESSWDLAGALRTLYQNPAIVADVVSPRLVVTETHVITRSYSDVVTSYPIDERLVVFDYRTRQTYRLANATAARVYFDSARLGAACPPGVPGEGVKVY